MHCSGWQKAELNLRVRRFETFPCPTAGTNGDERLIDRPRRTLFVDIGMGKSCKPRLLVWFESEISGDRDHREEDKKNANEVAQRDSADEKQRQQDRNPDERYPQIRLKHNQETGCAGDGAANEQTKHRMHLLELAEKQREHHDPGDHRELRRLEIDRANMEPAARTVNLGAHDLCQDEANDAEKIERQRAPTDPVVIHQTANHERKKPDQHPLRLFPPKIRRHRIFAHVSRAVDRDNAENGEREHDDQEQPVEAEQLSKKRRHVDLSWRENQSISSITSA